MSRQVQNRPRSAGTAGNAASRGVATHRRAVQSARSSRTKRAGGAAEIRRQRRRALCVLGIGLIIEGAVAALTSPALAIKRIRVDGTTSLPAVEANAIVRAATLPRGCNWFRVPRGRIALDIARMAWVKAVTIRKRLPAEMRVSITPRQPVAVAQLGVELVEVDAEGVPIRTARQETTVSLPRVVLPPTARLQFGVPLADRAAREAVRVLGGAATDQAVRVAKIEVDQSDNLCLNMRDNTSIRLGQAEDLDAKMGIVRRIYRYRPDIANSLAAIDLTCPAKPACISRSASHPEPAQEANRKQLQLMLRSVPTQEVGSQR
jgi:cell division protein FtsQ